MKKRLADKAKKSLIIVNPASGLGDGSDRTKHIKELAEARGWRGKIVETTRRKGASEIAKSAIRQGVTHLIICGGDGTVMEVLEVIMQTKVTLGVVPLGTGNLFARNLAIPLEMSEALKIALLGTIQQIDICQVPHMSDS
ncbi:hypothetical protein BH11PAT1_BH11PAT1_2920 [soil metagenome]